MLLEFRRAAAQSELCATVISLGGSCRAGRIDTSGANRSTAANRRSTDFSGLRSRQGRFARYSGRIKSQGRRVCKIARARRSNRHGYAGDFAHAVGPSHHYRAVSRSRALTKGPPRAQNRHLMAVPAASVPQGDFAHSTCSDLTGIRFRVPVSNGNGNKHRLASTGVGSGRAAGACRAFRDLDICHSAYVADPPLLFRRIAAMIPPERARWLVVANKQK